MGKFNIPGDTGHPWRLRKFIDYYAFGDIDANFPLLIRYADNRNLSVNDRFWLSFLYSSCYCVPTTCFLFEKLPLDKVTTQRAEKFWKDFKEPLIFQTDKRYVKNMNWFVPMVDNWLKTVGKNPSKFFKALEGSTIEQTYNNLYREIKSWRYFGRFTVFLLIEAIHKLTPLKADSAWFDWKKGDTATSGMMHILYLDEEAEYFDSSKKIALDTLKLLDKRLPQVIKAIQKKQPNVNITDLETALCGFRKLFKATRYGGYYIDRVQTEIATLQDYMPRYSYIWEELWKYRLEAFDHKLLGEVQGWKGIRKDLNQQWLEKGLTGAENFGKH